jgi:hypothetical protein
MVVGVGSIPSNEKGKAGVGLMAELLEHLGAAGNCWQGQQMKLAGEYMKVSSVGISVASR